MLKESLSLLLSLFYSKKESADVGHQAMMSSDSVTPINGSSITDWGQVATGIAAFDGYLVLHANGTGDASASLNLKNSDASIATLYPFATAGTSTVLPISKGKTWTAEGSFSKNITLKLQKTIGSIGGGLSFIQGGAICLNNLLHFLRRRSLYPRKSGSGINPCRPIIPCHLRQFGMNGRLLPLLLTGIFTFIARTLQELISYAIVLVSSQVLIHKGYLGQLFRVVKESRLATLFIRTIATLFVRLFSLKLSAAKTQGGAL